MKTITKIQAAVAARCTSDCSMITRVGRGRFHALGSLSPTANPAAMERIGSARGNWIVAAAVLGSSLVFIDGTVVSIALPVIQTQFGASAFDAQWVIEGYTLVLGALMLLCGALGDRYGRKRIFLAGVGVFAAGSVLCGI